MPYLHGVVALRIPDSYEAKMAKIWLVIKLIHQLFRIRQKAFLPNAPWM